MNNIKVEITFPTVGLKVFTSHNIISTKFARQLMDTTFDITPTVLEQYAEIVFKDYDGTLKRYARSGYLMKDLPVSIYIDDVLYNTYLTSAWDVKAQSSNITLHCNDPSKKLENIQVVAAGVQDYTLYNLFDNAFSNAGYSWTYDDQEVYDILTNTVCGYTYVQFQDTLTLLKKLCVVGFFRVYWSKDKFIVARCL